MIDLLHGRKSRFTFHPLNDVLPMWSPDGSELVFSSSRQVFTQLYRKRRDSADVERLFIDAGHFAIPEDWSPDGEWIMYSVESPGSGWGLWLAAASGDGDPRRYVQSAFNSFQAQFSPDGELIAYTSDESGAPEVYVCTFATPGRRWHVSTCGGTQPRWSRAGRELFYVAPNGDMMCVEFQHGPDHFDPRVPERLFSTNVWMQTRVGWLTSPSMGASYQVTADGCRFLLTEKRGDNMSAPVQAILNWSTLLGR